LAGEVAIETRVLPEGFGRLRLRGYHDAMKTLRYVYWQDEDMYLGYLEEFPDYMTQAKTMVELEENLKDLYEDLTSGQIPGVRRVAELQIA